MSQTERAAELVERRVETSGATLELVRRGEALDVVLDGRRVVSSDVRRSEQSLIELATAPLRGRDDVTLLVAGLGMGFTVRAALDAPGMKVTRVDVVEQSQAMIDWEAQHFCALNGDALKDPRVKLHATDLATFLKQVRLAAPGELPTEGWLALILDIDDGAKLPSRPGNENFYTDEGLERLEGPMKPGGVIALWSPERDLELLQRLAARFQNVAEVVVPVEFPDKMVMDYVYRGRRHPPPQDPAKAN